MQQVTVDFSEETLTALDEIAVLDHDGDRDKATRALLDDWITER